MENYLGKNLGTKVRKISQNLLQILHVYIKMFVSMTVHFPISETYVGIGLVVMGVTLCVISKF